MLLIKKRENWREIVYLAGDVGGTKTHLALYKAKGDQVVCVKEHKFRSPDFINLEKIVKIFLDEVEETVKKACFGIAGPIKKGKCRATNLPWVVDEKNLAKELNIEKVSLINDLVANAYGLRLLSKDEFFVLNEGAVYPCGNQALISAGTGLGEAGIYYDGTDLHPFASEGGHCDFAPTNKLEDDLLKYLRKKYTHISYERILSGPGLYNIYRFLVDTGVQKEDPEVLHEIEIGDSPLLISKKGMNEESKACMQTLELFTSIYGSEAGNVALKMLALGGVFLGGGIAPKILDVFKKGKFMKSFSAKGRFKNLLSSIPVSIILNDRTALLGSLYYAKNIIK